MQNRMKNTYKVCLMAMLTAISIVSLYIIRFPIIPAASFLEYDCADIPVILGALLINPLSGIIVLLAVCILQAITVSAASGWIGFLMHFIASTVLILPVSLIYKKKKSVKSLVIGFVVGTILMTLIMIPLNLVFTGIFLGAGTQTVVSMLMPAIIPFNLLKACINSICSFVLFIPLNKLTSKIKY